MALKVYYLDDEPALLELFEDAFSSKDRDIKTFNDPELALLECAQSPPDLIFIDYRLSNTTGDRFAKSLDPNIAKVLLTGEVHVIQGSQFKAVFEKPISIDRIEEFLSEYCRGITARK